MFVAICFFERSALGARSARHGKKTVSFSAVLCVAFAATDRRRGRVSLNTIPSSHEHQQW
jgi:hypothetical protein